MRVEKLEEARVSLIQAYLLLDEAIETTDSSEDLLVQHISGQRDSLQGIVGSLDMSVAKLEKDATD